MIRNSIIFLMLLSIGCGRSDPFNASFDLVNGAEISPAEKANNSEALVILYLSPECPLCQNYSVPLGKTIEKYKKNDVAFLGVVSGSFYSKETIRKYKVKYDMDLAIILDPEFELAKKYEAEITPEAHLLSKEGKLLYKGAIDNWAISLGQKRVKTSRHYLNNAIESYLANTKIEPEQTKPVGCFIE
jgi:peroxiredoxin